MTRRQYITPPNFDIDAEAIDGPTRAPWTGEHDTPPNAEWVAAAVREHNKPPVDLVRAKRIDRRVWIIVAILIVVAALVVRW
jgi:hypothetical protein